jgi:pimeloyl-ACP methyl ester carboxylesterase
MACEDVWDFVAAWNYPAERRRPEIISAPLAPLVLQVDTSGTCARGCGRVAATGNRNTLRPERPPLLFNSRPYRLWTRRPEETMAYQELSVRRDHHRIHAREYPGTEPAIILMHGFPDNLHLYDRLVPHLSPPRRVVLFDFLGWGLSDKPTGYPYTAANQVGDLDAVVTQLELEQVTLVAHDASGPPAIDWALTHPERVAGLVLLNTYYCDMPTLRRPEAIWLFSTPVVRSVAKPMARLFGYWLFRRIYWWQVGRFIRDADVRREFVPLLYQQFDATPSARPAFFRLNEDLLPSVRSRAERIPRLREFRRPVRIIFGDADRSLNSGVARTFHELLLDSELFLIPGAQHFVQLDEPEQVARLILAMPSPKGAPS